MLKVNPIAIFCYMFMTIFITMFTMHPIMLAISLFSSYVLYLTLGGVQKAVKSFSYILPIIVISAVFNGIFVHKGASILFYVGNTAITLEAIINGLATGTMFASVIYWFNCVNILLTSDKIVYIFSKYAPKIGTILMISLGLCPKYTKQFKKIDENLRALGLYEDAGIIKKLNLKFIYYPHL